MAELFAGLLGQAQAVALLSAALSQGRLAPAYLFSGAGAAVEHHPLPLPNDPYGRQVRYQPPLPPGIQRGSQFLRL
jgi:hypothetical protein